MRRGWELLVDRSVQEYMGLLSSGEPTPGGGSAAAMQGALGASLLGMVGRLTAGRAKHAAHDAFAGMLIERAQALRVDFLKAVDDDACAFGRVCAVFAMPKDSEAEKVTRDDAMREALKGCIQTPYQVMCGCLSALQLARQAIDQTNPSAAGDLGVSALSLKAALEGSWLNIVANISWLDDRAFADAYRKKGEAVLREALPIADEVYRRVSGRYEAG